MTTPVPLLSISLNGEALVTKCATLEELLVEHGFSGRKIATAQNGDFVPERARAQTTLRTGDRIEILSARQGG